jgi:2-oxoglutarate dehydrogenase E2 component (dihydrolipoamide succinyltransferase)
VVPALGESITEGTIAKWAKAEGDSVNADDVVVVVETDKVTVDIKANFRGVVVKHLAKENVSLSLFRGSILHACIDAE